MPRYFTKPEQDAFSSFKYALRTSTIRNPDGSIVFELNDIEIPEHWSQVATDILSQKYLRKQGVPQYDAEGNPILDESGNHVKGCEHSVKQVVHRLAGCWRYWGERFGYFKTEADAQSYYDEMVYMMLNQSAAPNSPQWFNTGLHWAYGVSGPAQGHHYVDPETKELTKSKDAYSRPQAHACADYFTQLYTEEGTRYIGEIVEKDLKDLKVFDGEKFVKILATKNNGEKEVYRIRLKNGNYVDLTDDHIVLSAEKRHKEGGNYTWKEVKELQTGHKLQQPLVLEVKEQNVFSEALAKARLAGWIIGDGSVGVYQNVMRMEIITINEQEYESVIEDLKEVFGEGVSYWVTSFKAQNENIDGKRIHLSGKKLHELVEAYELRTKSITAKVPKKIVYGSAQEKREFLKALFQADGCVRIRQEENSGNICLTTASRSLSGGVLQLLNSLGIYARISKNPDPRENRHGTEQVTVAYGSAREQYQEQIGFISLEKQEKLQLLNKIITRSKTLPIIREESIVSIEKLGVRNVYDIQTESGKFLGNGIVVHNCFIQSVTDDLVNEGGIMDLIMREARIFKYGSGTGSNFSKIRGCGEPLSGGGISSGLMSFLKINDRAAGAIKSGGTTRRAAKMVCLDLDHPDIEEFITWKVKEEQKVADLVAGSKICSELLQHVLDVCKEENTTNIKESQNLKAAVKKAIMQHVPMNFILRALKLAEQGRYELNFPVLNTDFQGEAYLTVSGQNSNNSIRIPNAFLDALNRNGDWGLVRRTDRKIAKTIRAKQLWDDIGYCAWACADPGVQYDDTINEWHTCPKDGKINASNPCSEFMFLDDTACNLASINLTKFLDDKTGVFDVKGYMHAIRLWAITLEISVLMAQFPSKEIAMKSYEFRTLGLGYANLGSLLMKLGIPYDSNEARTMCGAITAIMTGEAYATSAEMARVSGPFPGYTSNKDDMLRVIRNHRRAAYNAPENEYENLTVKPQGINADLCPEDLLNASRECWDRALEEGEKYGYRNAQVTVIAPTGTIGLLMDCDTTGIEPDFAIVKFKKLVGGGYFKIVNQSVPAALKRLGYSLAEISAIEQYCIGTGTLQGCPHINPTTLKEKGFTDEKIKALEDHMKNVFELKFAFNKFILGEEFCKSLGFAEEQLANPDFDMIEALGFTKQQIKEANDYVCGRMTLEQAPHLAKEHYAVFDCANRCGKYGQRFIAPHGHLKMMGAAQPFISGAISKTINMPHESNVEDIKEAYLQAWQLMIKAVALYRDGSKLSQPLNATNGQEQYLLLLEQEEDVDETIGPQQVQAAIQQIIYKKALPKKRGGFTQEALVGGHKIFLRTGEYPDGSLGEIFIDMYKEGAGYRGLVNCFAVLVSKALQYGVPLKELVETFTYTKFDPSGPVQGHENIKMSTSVLDYIFRVLGYEYLGRKDLVHITGEQLGKTQLTRPELMKTRQMMLTEVHEVLGNGEEIEHSIMIDTVQKKIKEAKSKGYTGEQCLQCGSMRVKRNGACSLCEDCGTSSGCS
ncbi:adenosylcobalamin-dependent ribonucleoside-diphosphate reductase [Candidatus Woesearchaeota archaeon]|nr:adenosylcobalamin-dependent ribonucleoside-diphosphate reductase [Candidatus Woesearchaeota archaeon]